MGYIFVNWLREGVLEPDLPSSATCYLCEQASYLGQVCFFIYEVQ